MNQQRFSDTMNTMFGGGLQQSEVIEVPDKMVGLSEYEFFHLTSCYVLSNYLGLKPGDFLLCEMLIDSV